MDPAPTPSATVPHLRDDEFEAVRKLLYAETGIALGAAKRDMAHARLAKRLRHLGLATFGEYLRAVRDGTAAGEMQQFINCLTTNKTDFFRESHHFDFLRDTVIPAARERGRRLRVWSAGCSTGEEPYTIAMVLAEHCPVADGWDARVLASDIDTAVISHAERGVYDADRVGPVPRELLPRYFVRGIGANEGKVAVRPVLRDRVSFRQINLMDDPWPVRTRFDAIFCRNVMIYFDHDTQRRLVGRFAELLEPGGHLFLGHSENLSGASSVLTPLTGTAYRRTAAAGDRPAAPPRPAALPRPDPRPEEHTIILGDVKVTRGPAVLKTLLGSCVSACLYDPQTQVGGMNHFSLPGVSDDGVSARYGAHAMELLVTAVMKQGGDRDRLRAKVFGGGRVLNVGSERLNVGARNAEFVLRYLSDEGIPIDGQSLGGTAGRIVRFEAHTGRVQAKPLPVRDMPQVVEREEEFGRALDQKAAAPDDSGITLF